MSCLLAKVINALTAKGHANGWQRHEIHLGPRELCAESSTVFSRLVYRIGKILYMGEAADGKDVLTDCLTVGMRGGPSAAVDRHNTTTTTLGLALFSVKLHP
jgi:hypothetical protein